MPRQHKSSPKPERPIRWLVVAASLVAILFCFWVGTRRVRVDSDLAASLPLDSPVLQSGRTLLAKHPDVDRVFLDLSLRDGSSGVPRLLKAADEVEQRLSESGLFSSVGASDWARGLAELHSSVGDRLPVLFSEQDLQDLVLPRLSKDRIKQSIAANYDALTDLEGIGQAGALAQDPLNLRELVFERLRPLIPRTEVRVEGNHILSADGKHLAITAIPHRVIGDAQSSRRVAQAIEQIAQDLERSSEGEQTGITMLAAGAYRAAADNEDIARRDTNRALWLVTIAVSVLLLGCFSRPLFGLLTLLPASAGVALALVLYSLVSDRMSALALGFGAALISITVDQGIVYLSYLDRVRGTSSRQAAQETFSAVSLATLTTVGAFLGLMLSGYAILKQLGIFAALGSALSFAFVHTVFPLMFRRFPSTQAKPLLPVDSALAWLGRGRVGPRLVAAIALLLAFGAFARPRFDVDVAKLNTVTEETRHEEQRLREVWGDEVFRRIYVLLEADTSEGLQQRSDTLARLLEQERTSGRVTSGLSASQFWPGSELAERNLQAWKKFWNEARRTEVLGRIEAAATEVGFSAEAFAPFRHTLESPRAIAPAVPAEAYSLLGIARPRNSAGWVWVGVLQRGARYDAAPVAQAFGDRGITVFDGELFAAELNRFLRTAFLRMLLIIAPFVLLSVVASFLHPRLVLLVLGPVILAFVCTLGALGMLGRPIDIPGLILGVVVLGMGTNFSVYLTRAHQRFPDPLHPAHDSVRVAALLDGGATILGMGALVFAEHAAARSAGICGVLGIGFSLLGTLLFLPPFLRKFVVVQPPWPEESVRSESEARKTVWARYRYLEPGPLLAAWFFLRERDLCVALQRIVGSSRSFLQVGCGYGLEAAWLLACDNNRRVVATESSADKARVAAQVLNQRGQVSVAPLKAVPALENPVEVALLIDSIQQLAEPELLDLLDSIRSRLQPEGRVVLRQRSRWHTVLWNRLLRRKAYPRSCNELRRLLERAGYTLVAQPDEALSPWIAATVCTRSQAS